MIIESDESKVNEGDGVNNVWGWIRVNDNEKSCWKKGMCVWWG